VREMPGDDEGERADSDFVAAGDAGAHPRFIGEIAEERNCGEADAAEFLDVRGPGQAIGLGAGDGDVLVEAGERVRKASGEPESAIGEDAFGIGDVAEDFANAPFFGRVAIERFFFRNAREKSERRIELGFELARDIGIRDAKDVSEIVGRGFGGFRESDHGGNVARGRAAREGARNGAARQIGRTEGVGRLSAAGAEVTVVARDFPIEEDAHHSRGHLSELEKG
jgi:hypothetical protein